MVDDFDYNSYFQSEGQHPSQQQVQQQRFLQEQLSNNNLRMQNSSMTSTSCSTKFFCTIGILQQALLQGTATSRMGIPKAQQQKWITTVQHNDFNTDIEKNNNELQNLVYSKVRHEYMELTSSTTSSIKRYRTTSSIRRYGFNIVISNIEMDKKNNNHLWEIQQRTTCPTIPLISPD